jgi:hypothetical protein
MMGERSDLAVLLGACDVQHGAAIACYWPGEQDGLHGAAGGGVQVLGERGIFAVLLGERGVQDGAMFACY